MGCADVQELGWPSDAMNTGDTSTGRRAILIVANGYPSLERPWKCPFNHRAVKAIEPFWNPSVITMRSWLPWRRAQLFSYDGIRVREVLVPHLLAMPRVLFDCRRRDRFSFRRLALLASIGCMANQIRKSLGSIELIHSIAAGRHAFAAQKVADEIGVPHIVQLIGSEVTMLDDAFARSDSFKKWIGGVHFFIANSKSLQIAFEKKTGLSLPITTIYRGVDTTVFTPRSPKFQPTNNRAYHVLYLGGHIHRAFNRQGADTKGADLLLRAWKLIELESSIKARLVIGGPMIDERGVKLFLQNLKYPERVTCLGALAAEDVPHVIRQADVLAIPSRMEGLPNVCLEAMACGVPVVATAVGGLSEVVLSETNGVLVPPDDVDALAAALINLFHNPSLIFQLGVKARKRVVEHFDSRDYGLKLIKVYNAAVAEQRKPIRS